MKFFSEFKEFISKGNVVDMAVGLVVGGAFTSIVNSLVKDVITPVINMITGKADIGDMSIQIGSATLAYGNFLQAIINFLIVGFAMFCVVKAMNTARNIAFKKKIEEEKKKEEEKKIEEAQKPTQEDLLIEIRDILKAINSESGNEYSEDKNGGEFISR